jgi:hypothetical protein
LVDVEPSGSYAPSLEVPIMDLTAADRESLLQAKLVLEHPGFAARIAEVLGRPIEVSLNSLPDRVRRAIGAATHAALHFALEGALRTLSDGPARGDAIRFHRLAGGIAGAAGGFFGLLALPAELPLSTLIILRAIASIARNEGEDMRRMESRLACLEVLGLGGHSPDSSAETGYYAARIGLAQSVTRAAEHIAKHGLASRAAPPVAEFLTRVGARFSLRVTEEVMAKAVPVVGAASGAAINTLFVHHFQEMAKAHFTIRRLERYYGSDHIRQAYEHLKWRKGHLVAHELDA